MAKIKNKRLDRSVTDKDPIEKKKAYGSILDPIKKLSTPRKIFLLALILVDIISFILISFIEYAIYQGVFIVALFVLNLIISIIVGFISKNKFETFVHVSAIFLFLLSVMSLIISASTLIGTKQELAIDKEINEIKSTSDLLISTDDADIYLDWEGKKIYSISDMFGSKYINKSFITLAENSEFYELYNLGVQINPNVECVDEVYVYPPTPHTMTGYEYLIEIKKDDVYYISRVFIPGVVDFGHKASSHIIDLAYGKDSDTMYEVHKIDQYLLFQSEYSSFSTPYKNVSYSEDEYFYVRYNRYLRAYAEEDEIDEISEENVRFINSLLVISPTIHKVNFFWIGDVVNESTFTAYLPVIEIVYDNNTSDIAIIKDIDAGMIKEILGY